MRSKETLRQLCHLTELLVGLSLSDDQNFPSTKGKPGGRFEISVNNAEGMTAALKNVAYREIYKELEQARCFNVKMLDGALLTLVYRFFNGEVSEHVLSYFPSPDFESFQNDPELYLKDEIYADIIQRNIVPFPVRFDFNEDPNRFVEVHHPRSHLSLGQFKNCRIPVCSPVSPMTFGGFVLRNFYNTAFRKYSDSIPTTELLFGNTIAANERNVPHLVLGKAI
jgi:hypothetical protein